MKKILAICIVISLVFCFCACEKSDNDKDIVKQELLQSSDFSNFDISSTIIKPLEDTSAIILQTNPHEMFMCVVGGENSVCAITSTFENDMAQFPSKTSLYLLEHGDQSFRFIDEAIDERKTSESYSICGDCIYYFVLLGNGYRIDSYNIKTAEITTLDIPEQDLISMSGRGKYLTIYAQRPNSDGFVLYGYNSESNQLFEIDSNAALYSQASVAAVNGDITAYVSKHDGYYSLHVYDLSSQVELYKIDINESVMISGVQANSSLLSFTDSKNNVYVINYLNDTKEKFIGISDRVYSCYLIEDSVVVITQNSISILDFQKHELVKYKGKATIACSAQFGKSVIVLDSSDSYFKLIE